MQKQLQTQKEGKWLAVGSVICFLVTVAMFRHTSFVMDKLRHSDSFDTSASDAVNNNLSVIIILFFLNFFLLTANMSHIYYHKTYRISLFFASCLLLVNLPVAACLFFKIQY